VSFFWLKYRYPDGIARLEATVFRLDDGLVFAGGQKIDDASAHHIPEMIDRLLDLRDLRRLQRLFLTEKPLLTEKLPDPVKNRPRRKLQRQTDGEPPAPSARWRTTTKRRASKP
jgi:hypothetical protein